VLDAIAEARCLATTRTDSDVDRPVLRG